MKYHEKSIKGFRRYGAGTKFKSKFFYLDLFILFLFDLILYVPSTIFQLYRDGSFWVEPVQS